MRFTNSLYKFIALAFACTVLTAPAAQAQVRLENGLAVVLDPITLERGGTVVGDEAFRAWVVLTDLPVFGTTAIQYRLEIDPRLTLLTNSFGPQVTIPLEVGPSEWIVSFGDCVTEPDTPLVVAELVLRVTSGSADVSNLTIDVGPLIEFGEPMRRIRCIDRAHIEPLVDMGGVVLNPSGPSIPLFTPDSDVVVEGRGYTLGWDTVSSSNVSLDGQSVGLSGTADMIATSSRVHTLVASDGSSTVLADRPVTVIREPQINVFTAIVDNGFVPAKARLEWDVVGGDVVELAGVGEVVPIGSALLVLNGGEIYEIFATNEWGQAFAQAETGDSSQLAPIITDFAANPPSYPPGTPVTLNWRIYNADSALVEPGSQPVDPRDGSIEVFPTGTMTYTLDATNTNGTSTASITVSPSPPAIDTFTLSREFINSGGDIVVVWSVRGATTVTLEPDGIDLDPVAGSVVVQPLVSTTYTLVARNVAGETTLALHVTVVDPEIRSFTASALGVFPGQPVDLDWSTSPGLDLRIDPDVGPVTGEIGSVTVFPSVDEVVYTLTATIGEVTLTATTTPINLRTPSLSLVANPTAVKAGEPFTLFATTAGADSLHIDPVPGVVDPAGGAFTVSRERPTLFTATATNAAGVSTRTVFVDVEVILPIVSLVATPSNPFAGEEFMLDYEIALADTASLEPGIGSIAPTNGSVTTSVTSTTEFVLRAANFGGAIEARVLVTARTPDAALTGPSSVFPGGVATLDVQVAGADSVFLEPGFGKIAGSGSYSIAVQDTTTFELRAINAGGVSTAQFTVAIRAPDVRLAGTTAVFPGELARLEVTAAGADSVFLEPGFGRIAGTGIYEIAVHDTTTFELRAINVVGATTSSLTVSPRAPIIGRFVAASSFMRFPQEVELSWETRGADTVELLDDQGLIETGLSDVGTKTLFVSDTTTFTLRTSNAAGSAQSTVMITVSAISIQSFAVDQDLVGAGSSVTLSWEVIGTGEVEVVGFGPKPLIGELDTIVELPSTFELRAFSGGDLIESRTVEVTVEFAGARTLSWSFAPDRLEPTPTGVFRFTPFEMWVVAAQPTRGVKAFEFRTETPPEILVIETGYPLPSSIDVGMSPNYIVGVGSCLAHASVVPLMQFSMLALDGSASNLRFDLAGSDPSSFQTGGPAYSDCLDVVRAFELAPPVILEQFEVPALIVRLEATRAGSDVILAWGAGELGCASRTLVMRSEGESDAQLVASLDGAPACGPWTDSGASLLTESLSYRVVLETENGTLVSQELSLADAPSNISLVRRATLLPNRPNPFNPSTSLRWALPEARRVKLDLFDTAGRHVRKLELGAQPAGEGAVIWDGLDDRGGRVASGVYLVRMNAEGTIDTRRIVLLK